MNPIVVTVSTADIETMCRLRDEFRARSMRCAVLTEPDPCDARTLVSACAALTGEGISIIAIVGEAYTASLVADLKNVTARVLAAHSPVETVVSELDARGWIPAKEEVYTDDELTTVTARLRDLGYA